MQVYQELGLRTPDNPSSQEYREVQLLQLLQSDIQADSCIAYHATSIETLEYMLRCGGLPGTTCEDFLGSSPLSPKAGDLYCMPRLETFPFERLEDSEDLLKDFPSDPSNYALYTCRDIADGIARPHRFLNLLDLDISTHGQNGHFIVNDYGYDTPDYEIALEEFQILGFSEKALIKAIEVSSNRAGVVVGIRKEAVDAFRVSRGDSGWDIRFNLMPDGMGIEFLSAVEPQGREEIAFFQQLARKYK